MTITNKLNLPEGLVKACSTDQHNESGCLSATTLIQGIKQILLTQRHWDELEEDVSERIWPLFGTAVHSLLETEGANDFAEIPMEYQVTDKTKITGRIDNYNMKDGIVADYKTSSVYKIKSQNFEDWYLQGMIYAWLLTKNKFPVKQCRFIAMLKDFSKNEAQRNKDYPKKPVYIYEFNVTEEGLKDIEDFIMQKVKDYEFYQMFKDGDIPECTEHERWAKAPVFAVMKKGRKTAVKLFQNPLEAELYSQNLGKDYFVEFRGGESVRCKGYCACCEFCSFYQSQIGCDKEKSVA